ncbi:ComF family protein [Candidatus Margulisiibacteriota bacterium]
MSIIFESILDLIFPPKCETCFTFVNEPICKKCLSKISYLKPAAFINAVGEYEGVLKKSIKRFKFKKRGRLAKPLSLLMSNYINHHLWKKSIDLLIPVPLHEKRLQERGFNQSELLCLNITKTLNLPTVAGVLFRKKNTHPQFDLKKRERYHNIKGAFEIKGSPLIKEKNILLIDDILTTGSTVRECTSELKSAGAKSVQILALSRAL